MSNEHAKDEVGTWAWILYLANLLIAPGIAFLIQGVHWHLSRLYCDDTGRVASRTALAFSIIAGLLIIGIVLIILSIPGAIGNPNTWVILVVYFTTVHASLVLFGVVGLSAAMAGRAPPRWMQAMALM